MENLHGLASFLPDGFDLFFYLGNFFLVASTLVVWDLCFELWNLLLILPVKSKLQNEWSIAKIYRLFRNSKKNESNSKTDGELQELTCWAWLLRQRSSCPYPWLFCLLKQIEWIMLMLRLNGNSMISSEKAMEEPISHFTQRGIFWIAFLLQFLRRLSTVVRIRRLHYRF